MSPIKRYFILRDVQIVLLILSIAIASFSVFVAIKAYNQSLKPLIIGIDKNGTRLLKTHSDPLFKVEVVNFIKIYIEKLYNFSPSNFEETVGLATNFMSESLWNEKKDQILSLKEQVKKNQITVQTKLQEIKKMDDGSFLAKLKTDQLRRSSKSSKNFQLKLSLNKITRNEMNPYGIEVISYEEIY